MDVDGLVVYHRLVTLLGVLKREAEALGNCSNFNTEKLDCHTYMYTPYMYMYLYMCRMIVMC